MARNANKHERAGTSNFKLKINYPITMDISSTVYLSKMLSKEWISFLLAYIQNAQSIVLVIEPL